MKEAPLPILPITLSDGFSFEMIYVEGGEFDMGSNEKNSEKPIHRVKVSSFYLGKFQVTQALWQAVMCNDPSGFKGENHPVETVSWDDTQGFLKKLNEATGKKFRLPSEAEWEFAARGGIYSQGYDYCGSDKLKQVGWYRENSNNETHDVGLLLANELGLYDMSGNVWEWCEDRFDEKFYEKCKNRGLTENPVNTVKGVDRVRRGGSYFDSPLSCRSTYRFHWPPDARRSTLGFRLVVPSQSVG